MQPVGRHVRDLDHERERHHDVPDNQDDEISGCVVGAVVVKGFATDRAMIRHLEEGPEHSAPVAIRATPEKSAPDRLPGRSRRQPRFFPCAISRGGKGGRLLRRILPAHRRRLRLRPASPPEAPSFAPFSRRDLRAEAPRCPFARMRAVASRRPSDNISKRSAPPPLAPPPPPPLTPPPPRPSSP